MSATEPRTLLDDHPNATDLQVATALDEILTLAHTAMSSYHKCVLANTISLTRLQEELDAYPRGTRKQRHRWAMKKQHLEIQKEMAAREKDKWLTWHKEWMMEHKNLDWAWGERKERDELAAAMAAERAAQIAEEMAIAEALELEELVIPEYGAEESGMMGDEDNIAAAEDSEGTTEMDEEVAAVLALMYL